MDSHPLLPALLLHHVPGLGPNRIKLALQQFRCFKTLLTQNDQFWLKGIRIGQKGWSAIREWQNQGRNSTLYQRAQEGLNWLNESDNNHIFSLACSDYPAQLKNIFDPPLILYIKGNAALLSKQQIAVVGARQATRSGLDTAFQYSKVLSRHGWLVVSGLALGIDGAAHRGCLDGGHPTIAVLGSGINVIYPKSHASLAIDIENNGALVSEFPLNTQPRPGYFPQRNRIISGLSEGILVVEAAEKSGSLITAIMALEEGRDVFAIPGSIHNPWARGCHKLIQQGARLVMDSEDLLLELPKIQTCPGALLPQTEEKKISSEFSSLLAYIDYDPTPLDEIISRAQMDIAEIMDALLHLELAGSIAAVQGGYCLTGK